MLKDIVTPHETFQLLHFCPIILVSLFSLSWDMRHNESVLDSLRSFVSLKPRPAHLPLVVAKLNRSKGD